jgi:two-component system OmpR family sensor kinase
VSLRARLLLTTLVLLVVGLGAADVATYGFLRSFLTKRVDQQLVGIQLPASRELGSVRGPGVIGGRGGRLDPNDLTRALVPPGAYAELRDTDGTKLQGVAFGFSDPKAVPNIPNIVNTPNNSRFFTVSASGNGDRYRVLAAPLTNGGTLIVALPLGDVSETLSRLLGVEVAVSLGVLLCAVLASFWFIRAGLRPLERMGRTAGAIAAGDLTQRVAPAESRTEVGRLGLALNTMLTQIEEAFRERKASEDRLRRFVADASHELRTPLASIRGWSELFHRGAASRPDDLAKTMRRIEEEATHMGTLVETMLSLARFDEGVALAADPVDLSAIVTDAVEDAKVIQPERPITADVAGGVIVEGDETRFREVIENLLANVRTHTPVSAAVHVRLRRAGPSAVVEVMDRGPGIPAQDLDRVFERFFRADPSRTRASGGAGLGLSIVAEVVRAYRGDVAVESVPGSGATFRVTLPLADAASEGPAQSGEAPPVSPPAATPAPSWPAWPAPPAAE